MKIDKRVNEFLDLLQSWVSTQPHIQALVLVGSYARGSYNKNSDIDLVLLTQEPKQYLSDVNWIKKFGSVTKRRIEHYGKVTSLRIWYSDEREVEYSITDLSWIHSPLDAGTRRVLNSGAKVLFEREALVSPHLRN